MAELRTYAVSCVLVKGPFGGEIIHTLVSVDAEDEHEAAGSHEDAARAENPGYKLLNTAVLLIPDPWEAE